MKTKLRFLFVAVIISLGVIFSTTGRIFFNDNYGVAFGNNAPPYETSYWCGQYGGSCPINDYYVNDNSPNDPGSGTKLDPYRKIEDAKNAASSGNTIHVAEGEYKENIQISKELTLEGGWDNTFSQRDPDTNVTVIDGNYAGTVIKILNNSPTIDGFTITHGNATNEGGAFYIEGTGSPTISNNHIIDNHSDETGGGIYAGSLSTYPIIKDNIIELNSSDFVGGGIGLYAASSDTMIVNNVIRNNEAVEGGGIGLYLGSANVVNNIIVGNKVFEVVENQSQVDEYTFGGKGCGVYIYGPTMGNGMISPIISNNTVANNIVIVKNAGVGDGGGVYVEFEAFPTITNTILWGNDGDELYYGGGASVFISFSDIDDVNYNGPNNNISADPLFVNSSTGDYHLLLGSPAIDTGKDTSSLTYGLVVDDIIGTLRPQDGDGNGPASGDGSDYDMGAYEMPAMMQAFVENNPEQVSVMDDTLNEKLNRKVAVKPAQKRTSNVIPKKSLNRGKSISRYKR